MHLPLRGIIRPHVSSSLVTSLTCLTECHRWGPVSWVYIPELFPLRLRGKGVALSTSGNWAFNTALGLFVPPAFVNIKWETYIVFGVFNTVMFLHVLFIFPETAGKTLEETEAMFEDPNGIKYLGTPAWKTSVGKRGRQMEHGDVESKLSFAEAVHTEEGAKNDRDEHHEVTENKTS